jgi:hypothetical protein
MRQFRFEAETESGTDSAFFVPQQLLTCRDRFSAQILISWLQTQYVDVRMNLMVSMSVHVLMYNMSIGATGPFSKCSFRPLR